MQRSAATVWTRSTGRCTTPAISGWLWWLPADLTMTVSGRGVSACGKTAFRFGWFQANPSDGCMRGAFVTVRRVFWAKHWPARNCSPWRTALSCKYKYMSRILLLLDHKQNRELLAQYLAAHYQVLPEEHQLLEPFDLCVVDPPALERLHEQVRARKASEQPVFLPVLLVASHHAVSVATHHLWEIVDESIAAPIHKTELQARVEILLHARQLSRENASLLGQLETELARAGEVQTQLLPRELPALEDFDLAARCLPARQVGGDFYD